MEDARENLGRLLALSLLVVVGFTLCFYHYDSGDLRTETAARVANMARDMNTQGQWLLALDHPASQVQAPPLYLWLVKVKAMLSPDVESSDVRMPAALFGFLCVMLIAFWLYGHINRYRRDDGVEPPMEGFALLAGLMLASSPLLFQIGRAGTANTLFAFFYLAAAYCWSESLEARRSFYSGRSWRFWMLCGYALAGIAMLVGGPLVMLMLWIPYILAARSYRLHGLDWSHLAGVALAGVLGAWWPWAIGQAYPDLLDPGVVWRQWLTLQSGAALMVQWGTMEFLENLLLGTLPWLLPALIMAWRVWRRLDRSPTLVFWMWSLVANMILLTLLNGRAGSHPLPLAAFVALMATDALFRWNFENGWARVWRTLIRLAMMVALPAGMFIAAVINSDLGMVLFILITIGWIRSLIRSRYNGIQFTPWVTTVRLVSIAVVVFLAMEIMFLADWMLRAQYHDPVLSYYSRVQERLREDGARLYLYAETPSPLHDYYMEQPVNWVSDLAAVPRSSEQPVYLFAGKDVAALQDDVRFVPITTLQADCGGPPAELFLRHLSAKEQASVEQPSDRLDYRLPYRIALLGRTGTRRGAQRDVAESLEDLDKQGAIDDVVLLGNNIKGPSVFDHLNFVESFENPYQRLLRHGVRFHATLGHEDQSYAFLQTRYPAFNMCGKNYYQRTLGGGIADLFVLDSETLHPGGTEFDLTQLTWLDQRLAASRAPWKIVTLYRALSSQANDGRVDRELAAKLLPILDRHHVDLVAWAGAGFWYERLELPNSPTMFLNLGWSGENEKAEFAPSPSLQKSYDRHPGFFYLDLTLESMVFRAVNKNDEIIDMGHLNKRNPDRVGRGAPTVIDLDASGPGAEPMTISTTTATTVTAATATPPPPTPTPTPPVESTPTTPTQPRAEAPATTATTPAR